MAIAPTGAIYKSLYFDGEDSRDYGVYITGEAVYNAPEREVEMIPIPGRNGQLALDKGRFENIEVSYPAGIFAETEADFAEAVSNFRNFLCSRNGYVRLQDDYNPNEYRLAIYKSGLEVKDALHRAGEFDIVFDCKPQRYLTSGETAISVDSGDVITNPTLFESSPMIMFVGYGDATIGDSVITKTNGSLGTINVSGWTDRYADSANIEIDGAFLITYDTIGTRNVRIGQVVKYSGSGTITSATVRAPSGVSVTVSHTSDSAQISAKVYENLNRFIYKDGYEDSNGYSLTVDYTILLPNSTTVTTSSTLSGEVIYDGDSTITITTFSTQTDSYFELGTRRITADPVTGFSSYAGTGTVYIDCEIGEAYFMSNGEIADANNLISLGSDVPKLAPGANTITFDNTITDFQVIPRWWKI